MNGLILSFVAWIQCLGSSRLCLDSDLLIIFDAWSTDYLVGYLLSGLVDQRPLHSSINNWLIHYSIDSLWSGS